MPEYFLQATNPQQYDSEQMSWEKEGLENSPTRALPQDYPDKYLDVSGKTVLDIGCGMGQLFSLLKRKSATSITGIDPAESNVQVCLKNYSDVETIRASLEDFKTLKKFDVAVMVYVFEHLGDVSAAFRKISDLLNPKGFLYLIHVDKVYGMTQRFGYRIDSQEVDAHTTAVKTTRSVGTMYDLLRTPEYYIMIAKEFSLQIKNCYPMTPTERFMDVAPKYKEFAGNVISHLIILQKD